MDQMSEPTQDQLHDAAQAVTVRFVTKLEEIPMTVAQRAGINNALQLLIQQIEQTNHAAGYGVGYKAGELAQRQAQARREQEQAQRNVQPKVTPMPAQNEKPKAPQKK